MTSGRQYDESHNRSCRPHPGRQSLALKPPCNADPRPLSALLLCPPALDLIAMPMPSPSPSLPSAVSSAAMATDALSVQAGNEGAGELGSNSGAAATESTPQEVLPLDSIVDPLVGWEFLVLGLDRKVRARAVLGIRVDWSGALLITECVQISMPLPHFFLSDFVSLAVYLYS